MDNASFYAPSDGSQSPQMPPPPPLPPPPVITPPPAPKPRRSWGWMITAVILAVLLCFAGIIILAQFALHSVGMSHNLKSVGSREIGPKLEECILEEGTTRNKIAVIEVDGIITGHAPDEAGNSMVDVIKAQLDRAADDDRVKAVILKVDSPG